MSNLITGMPLLGVAELLTQQAFIERAEGVRDEYGARRKQGWQPLATVQCFMWWGTSKVLTRMGSIQQRPESTIDIETAGMILPDSVDITARDRISQVLDEDGSVFAHGPLMVLAVGAFTGLTEVSLRRTI